MKLEDKIYASIGLTVFLTIVYYYVYSFVDLYVSKLCDKYVCFEFPPYADVLALWVAIIGLYFVVTTLDDWKKQDKYQRSITNIEMLHNILKNLKTYVSKLNNISNFEPNVLFTNKRGENKSPLYLRYKAMSEHIKLEEEIKSLDYNINMRSKCLFQEDFTNLTSLLHNFFHNIDSEIYKKEINHQNSNSLPLSQDEIDLIFKNEHEKYIMFQNNLNKLQDKLNNFVK